MTNERLLLSALKKIARDGLREYTKMKYIGDCKCGQCQLVPLAVIIANADIIEAQSKALAEARAGWKLVPVKPTSEMLNAAIDVDSFKLGDISPLGFRISPQMLFEECYAAMLAACPKGEPQ